MSTSDAVVCLANGGAKLSALEMGTEDFRIFASALEAVCVSMAKALVRDGEGATKFVEIAVEGAVSHGAAKTIARSIATSQLCKTAFFGEDPNWGRFACAAGYAGTPFDPKQLRLWIGDLQVVAGGALLPYAEEDAVARMKKPDINIRVSVGDGPGLCSYWTSDLSHDYVKINADYRT